MKKTLLMLLAISMTYADEEYIRALGGRQLSEPPNIEEAKKALAEAQTEADAATAAFIKAQEEFKAV